MLHANRNGFFYVFDRTDGKLLLAKQFVRNLTWASGIGADGRPIKTPNQEPSPAGNARCALRRTARPTGSRHRTIPRRGCTTSRRSKSAASTRRPSPATWTAGQDVSGRLAADDGAADGKKPERILKAIDIKTGKISWELPQPGPAESWGGTLSTATGLVIFGEEGGALMAADAVTGKPLWSFQTNQSWKASPMAYQFDGKQYIGVAAGGNILAFSILE